MSAVLILHAGQVDSAAQLNSMLGVPWKAFVLIKLQRCIGRIVTKEVT